MDAVGKRVRVEVTRWAAGCSVLCGLLTVGNEEMVESLVTGLDDGVAQVTSTAAEDVALGA